MSDPVTEMDENGQEPVDEHEPVLRTGAHCPPPRPGGKPGLVTLLPQRAHFGDEFSDHISRQSGDPAVADDHCASHGPYHSTMINHPGLDVSPHTVHELVRAVPQTSLVPLWNTWSTERSRRGFGGRLPALS